MRITLFEKIFNWAVLVISLGIAVYIATVITGTNSPLQVKRLLQLQTLFQSSQQR
jgi:hypothetical protein